MTIYRLCDFSNNDVDAIIKLWREVFGDGEDFIRTCIAGFAGRGQVYLACSDRGVEAMLLAVPCSTKSARKGIYLYALATVPKRRGQGVMTKLMNYAEEAEKKKGAVFAALIPADVPLYGFYAARGYTKMMYAYSAIYAPKNRENIANNTQKPDYEKIIKLRERYMNIDYLQFDDVRMRIIADDISKEGALIACSENAYAVFCAKDRELFVAEMCANNKKAAQDLLFCLCSDHKCKSAKVMFAGSEAMSALFADAEKVRVGAMKLLYNKDDEVYGSISSKLRTSEEYGYIRFALEDVWGMFR